MNRRQVWRLFGALLIGAVVLISAGAAMAQAASGGGGGGAATAQVGAPITLDQAVQAARAYVARLGNADLVLDEAMEFEQNFYVIVKEKSTGIGAFELLVDKTTGNVFQEFGPDMMWNTKYGHMAGMGYGMMNGPGMMGGYGYGPGMMGQSGPGMMGGRGPSAATTSPTVTADQASQIAQQWLDANQPGSTTEPPDAFYGYYTIHTLKDGAVTGMLSVNAYTGQVWYHTWHGAFIQMQELGE